MRPSLERALSRSAPKFEGLGTDRSAAIVGTARDLDCVWSAQALSNVPPEFMECKEIFEEQPESESDKAQRLLREYQLRAH